MPIQTGDNKWSVTNYIVDPTPGKGDFTTISDACAFFLANAITGITCSIKSGTYTEDVASLAPGITYTALGGSQTVPSVSIVGKVTVSEAGTYAFFGITIMTNGDFGLVVSGSNLITLKAFNCNLNAADNTFLSFTNTNASTNINIKDGITSIGTTGITCYSMSSPGNLSFINTQMGNSGGSTTPSNNSAGVVALSGVLANNLFSTSSTGIINIFPGCTLTPAINATPLTTLGTGTSNIFSSTLGGGTASSLSIGSGTTVNACNLTITSSNTNAITGLGILNRGLITFNGTSSTINTSTQNAKATSIGTVVSGACGTAFVPGRTNGAAPAAGFIGEQLTGNAVAPGAAIATTTPQNITSVSLTAGVWDVSGVAGFIGWTTASQIVASIGTTSATLGTLGNNRIDNTGGVVAGSISQCLTIPSYRINLSSTTTVYLVGYIAYTAGSATTFGTIRATRVG